MCAVDAGRVVQFDGHAVVLEPGETVLDALLRSGIAVAHSCKAGVCQSCLMRLASAADSIGDPRAQAGLNDALRARGYFLACQMVPQADLAVKLPSETDTAAATITSLEFLSPSVLQVRLQVLGEFQFHPGQYVSLIRPGGLTRSYSIANRAREDHSIELHVRRTPGGQMSTWLFEKAAVGDPMRVRGPAGSCFYVSQDLDAQPLLLAGTGTGLAPLYGILQDALAARHPAPICLFHGARNSEGLYLQPELSRLSAGFPQFQYVPTTDPLLEVIEERLPDLTGWRAYLCGDPRTVRELEEQVFLAGAASQDIFSDPFLAGTT